MGQETECWSKAHSRGVHLLQKTPTFHEEPGSPHMEVLGTGMNIGVKEVTAWIKWKTLKTGGKVYLNRKI